jgi:hypothetical protein
MDLAPWPQRRAIAFTAKGASDALNALRHVVASAAARTDPRVLITASYILGCVSRYSSRHTDQRPCFASMCSNLDLTFGHSLATIE